MCSTVVLKSYKLRVSSKQYMLEMIYARRNAEKKEERYDLFSSLLDASEDDSDGQTKLTDQELLGEWPEFGWEDICVYTLYRKHLHFLACRS